MQGEVKSVRFQGVGQRFSPETPWLFRGLTEAVREGERCALVGPSGSGKSTLLSIVAGWLPSTEGTILLEHIRGVQWVFQNPHGVSRRAAIDHVALPLLATGMRTREADSRALEFCHLVGLDHLGDRRPFSMLSGGEAQRLMLARALATSPDLLLVDEPTAQLDRHSAATVNSAIAAIGDAGGIVLVATHDPETADACDRRIDLAGYAAPSASDLEEQS
jgi:ABC-type lipoprotein export system ATPase subunit